MVHDKTKSVTSANSQLPFQFDDQDDDPGNNDLPLPELISHGGDTWDAFPLQYHDVDGTRFYAVQDWLRGIALTDNPRAFWTEMKKRFTKAGTELSTWCLQLKYRATDGKNYKLDFADAENLYRITQRMDTTTGIRNKVLDYLAKAGVKLDQWRVDPGKGLSELADHARAKGKSPEWIAARISSIGNRSEFTAALKQYVIDIQQRHYAEATNTMYIGLWGRDANELKSEMSLRKQDKLRDFQINIALNYQGIVEGMVAHYLGDAQEVQFSQAKMIIQQVSEMIGVQANQTAQALGLDLATGKKLLR